MHSTRRLLSIATAGLMASPVVYVVLTACGGNRSIWQGLWATRLPGLLLTSVALTAVVTCGAAIIGCGVAWLVECTDLPGRRWLRPLLIAPLIIPCYITAVAYTSVFGARGLAEQLLGALGLSMRVQTIYGFWGAAALLVLGTYPYVYAMAGSALRRVDPKLIEAARCLGIGQGVAFRRVVLPLLVPALTGGGVLAALYVLSDFGVVSLLRVPTFVTAIYQQMSARYDYSTAAALSVVLVSVMFGLLATQERLGGLGRYASGTTTAWGLPLVRLRRLKGLACAGAVGLVAIGLIVPLGVLAYWLIQSLHPTELGRMWGTAPGALLRSGLSSLSASALASTIAVTCALPLAYWMVREPSRFGRAITWAAQSGIALPGVLIALGLALFFRQLAPGLTFSVAALVLAYVVHFFAQALQSARAGLTQVSPRLEEEARLLGCSPFRTFWLVSRPLLGPALWTGWILVFLSAMRELPASLLLRPAGFDPLTVRVWIAASEGFYAQAAAPALVLVGLSLPLVMVIFRGDGIRHAHS